MDTAKVAQFFARSAPKPPMSRWARPCEPTSLQKTCIGKFEIKMVWKSKSKYASIKLNYAGEQIAFLGLQGVDKAEADMEYQDLIAIIKN